MAVDEEKGRNTVDPTPTDGASASEIQRAQEQLTTGEANIPTVTDIFSWQDVKYVVPIGSGQTRQLLDDVSGYVAPGKLTALMGESGAGKVSNISNNRCRKCTKTFLADHLVKCFGSKNRNWGRYRQSACQWPASSNGLSGSNVSTVEILDYVVIAK